MTQRKVCSTSLNNSRHAYVKRKKVKLSWERPLFYFLYLDIVNVGFIDYQDFIIKYWNIRESEMLGVPCCQFNGLLAVLVGSQQGNCIYFDERPRYRAWPACCTATLSSLRQHTSPHVPHSYHTLELGLFGTPMLIIYFLFIRSDTLKKMHATFSYH